MKNNEKQITVKPAYPIKKKNRNPSFADIDAFFCSKSIKGMTTALKKTPTPAIPSSLLTIKSGI